MKKLLQLPGNVFKQNRISLMAVLVCFLLLGMAEKSQAQVYYILSDPSAANTADDAIKRIAYDGTQTVVRAPITSSPNTFALDLPNNRAFVYNLKSTGNTIDVVNLTTGVASVSVAVPTGTTTLPLMRYDPIGNYLYYTANNGTGAADDVNALYRLKPDGSENLRLVPRIGLYPSWLALNIENNKIYVYDGISTARRLLTVDITTNTVTTIADLKALYTQPHISAIEYDRATDYIYYTSTTGQYSDAVATDDALGKMKPDGSGRVIIKASVMRNPIYLALDAAHGNAYLYEGYIGAVNTIVDSQQGIYKVNLSDGTTTSFVSMTSLPSPPAVSLPQKVWGIATAQLPYVTTSAATLVTAASATANGNATRSDEAVTARGVVYSSSNTTPTIGGSNVTNATASVSTGTGAFTASLSSLSPVTTYYVRAYATSVAGTTYGAVQTFSTTSNDATLSAFAISSGTLNPTFAAATTTYTASVANATTAITVTPTRNQANATIKVNNTTVASGAASGSLALNIGDNTITTVVTAQDGTTTKTYALTVTRPKAAQTITFASTASKTFGNADFAAGASTNSGLTISYTSSNTGVATVSGSTIHIVGAGSTTITASQAGDANTLAATNATQTLTVGAASQTITFGAITAKTYGNADFAPGATAGSGAAVTYSSDNTAVATIVSNQVHIVGQGTANITASQAGNTNYSAAANVVQSLTVNKATVTVTAAAKTKVYGDADPTFTYTATGVVGADAPTGSLSRATPTTTNRFVGTYAIDQGTLTYGNNYNVTYVGANLTITKRPLTIAPLPVTKQYGDADFAQGAPYSFNGTSIAVGDAMSGSFSRTPASENVGTYALGIGLKHPLDPSTGEDRSANYTISFVTNTFTITPKPVTVNARAQTKTYGDADPTFTYNDSGLAFSDSFTGALTRVAGEGFGTYAISKGTLALSSNYTLTFTGSDLTIGKKTVNVAATAQTKTYGDTDPTLTYTADALASGDSFTGALTRAAGENFGTYAISRGNLALNSNYTLNFTGANLTINKKTINVAAAAKTKTYGDTDPALTYTADALVGGESFTGAITRAAGESFGSYAITQGTLALSSNYNVNYTSANLTIGKRAIDIYSGSRDVPYGDPDGTIGYSYSGTPQGGDAFSGALSRQPGTAIGTYATTIGDFQISNGSNYDLVFHSAPFNIVQREITVSGGSTFKIYGDADPAINYSIVSGTLLGGTQITGALTRDAGETAGPYNVGQGTLAIGDGNYKLTYQGGYFEIDRAPLTLTIDNKTKVATKPNPALTYSVSGLKNGDTEATAFTAPINLITDANINSGAGDYNIYPVGGAFAINYDVTTVGGTLTVTPASSNNLLASATVNGGGFDGATFDPATEFYSVNIPNGSTSATLIATVADPLSTLSVGAYPAIAVPITSGAPYTVNFSNNQTEQVGVHVTAEDGSIKSYYFNINPIPSDSKLSNLDTNIGIIAPSFNPLVTSYTLDVPADTEFLTITPTTHDRLATARVSGGGEGGSTGAKTVAINEGGNPISITVRSADRTGTTPYFLYVKRPIRLATLTISDGHLFPAFDPNIDTYTAKVNSAIPSITVTATGNKSYFTTLVNGDYVNYGDASAPVTINEDGSTTILVKIIAGDGETSKTYTINVVHGNSNADLASIGLSTGALDPTFDAVNTTTYNVYLPNATTAFSFTPTVADAGATLTVNNDPAASGATITNNAVTVGLHNYYLSVIAGDGVSTKLYTLSVHRAPSSEPGLSNIILSHGTLSPAFDQAMYNSYDVIVPNEVASIDVTPVLIDTAGSISARLNGHNVALPTGVITAALAVGVNSLIITSVAQDGTTMAITSVIITRLGDPALRNLAVSTPGTFSPAFNKDTYSYTASVDYAAATYALTPTLMDAGNVLKVNGNVVTNDVETGVNLTTGDNTITIEVAAPGGDSRTYTIVVNRAAPATDNYLAGLTASDGTFLFAFDKDNAYNQISVPGSVSNVTVTPVTSDPKATITVNYQTVLSGMASQPLAAGSSYQIAVTAEDGSQRFYTVEIKKLSTNANLYRLETTSGAISPAFNSDTQLYSLTVPANISSTGIIAQPADTTARVSINGLPKQHNYYEYSMPLGYGTNTIQVAVTPQEGADKVYTIAIFRTPLSNVATLSNLRSSAGTLTAVAGASRAYAVSVAYNTNTATITAVPADAGASITVNGLPVAANTASQPIALVPGANTATVLVTAADGVATRTYTVTITRAPSNIATLTTLRSSAGPLTAVAGNNYGYTVSVANYTTTATITAVPADAGASITVDGMPVAANTASQPIALLPGANTATVLVTAADGVATRTYTITITRALSNIATLSALRSSAGTLTAVAGNNYGYTASVANNTTTATITAVPADAGASITVNGVPVAANTASQPIPLALGANTATVLVTAADGVATRTYTVTITRALYANIATLTALRSSAGKLTAVGGPNHEYTVSVGATVNTATVTAVPADANASITVNGVPVAANVASQPIALNTGPNTVSVIVLAEDGVATRTYTVTITKASPPVIASIPTKQTDIGIIQRTDASLKASPEDFIVKQALSPNGDGVNDRLTIDGIDLFPNNTVRIMNRNGDVVYEAKGYDNLGKSFDGHSSKGTMQQAGTYFYSIEYKKGSETKRKTGYIVIKY